MNQPRTPRQIIGDDAYMQLVFEGYEVVKAAELSRRSEVIERAKEALEEFGTSRVRDRVAARVGCNHDILHDALQIEVRAARALLQGESNG